MEAKFGELHKDTFGKNITGGGAPDQGNGYYARALPYKEWFIFNYAVRSHIHILEWMPFTLTSLIVGGLTLPIPAAIATLVYTLGRAVLTIGLLTCGLKGRVVGSFVQEVGIIGSFVIAVWSLVKIFL